MIRKIVLIFLLFQWFLSAQDSGVFQTDSIPTNQKINMDQREKINVLNLSLELWGRSPIGSLNIGYVMNDQHAFDMGYNWGYATLNTIPDSEISGNIIYIGYSYLILPSKSKIEMGAGIGIGKLTKTEKISTKNPIKSSASFIFTAILGYRYQNKSNGFLWKAGIVPVLMGNGENFIVINWGIGYTFKL